MKNMDFEHNLDSLIILITGASGQLGLEYQKLFLHNKSKVVGIDICKNKGIENLEKNHSDNYAFFTSDVTNSKNLTDVSQKIIKLFGTPNVIINNAALDSPPSAPESETGPFEEYPEKSWDKVLDVNLKGTYLVCQIFGKLMAEKKVRGSIINISSIYGIVSPDQSLYQYRRDRGETFFKPVAYSASKAGILNLTRYLAVYWGRKNIRVNTLTLAGVYNNQDKEFLDAYCSRIPIGRMANPKDYFGPLVFLSSEASAYMTGSNLIVDGGWTSI